MPEHQMAATMIEPMIIKTLQHFVQLNMADVLGFKVKVMSML